MADKPLSIIIPTAGRSIELENCLFSLRNHSPYKEDISIHVIDNNVNLSYSNRVKEICSSYPEFQYSRCLRPGLTSARHMGLEATNSEILCFVDDDVIFSEGWIDSVLDVFQDPSTALAGGPTVPRFSGSVPPWLWEFFHPSAYGGWCCPWLSLLDIGRDINSINPNLIWGLNFAIRRDVLLECGGFHIDLVPKQYMRWQGDGETGLTMKLAAKGYNAAYRQDSLLFHQCGPDRLNPEYFAKRAYYQGVCNSYTELRRRLRDGELQQIPASQANTMKGALKCLLDKFTTQIRSRPKPQVPQSRWAADASVVRALCQQAEHDGYLFHQNEAAADPSLREWICRDHYFNVDLRDLCQS